MKTHYDIIIIWAGAAGLFTAISAPEYYSKLLLEKNKNPWVKILLSGGERANVSNMDIVPERDYFGQNKKALISLFKNFHNYDIISFFEENGVKIVEEDRGRLILESGDSKELLSMLIKKALENHTQIKCEASVVDINPPVINDIPALSKGGRGDFEVLTADGTRYTSDRLVITTWWKSFSHVGTTGDWYKWAENFGHTIITPHRWLCGLVTKKDLSEVSGVSCEVKLEILVKTPSVSKANFPPHWGGLRESKTIYCETWPLLFTHFWVSGPIIFNGGIAIGEYINSLDLSSFIDWLDFSKIPPNEKQDYIERNFLKENISLKLTFSLEKTAKRLVQFFTLDEENNSITLELQDYRTWKEAKVTWGGIKIDELTNKLESKLIPWLYFAGEILDVTGKTGGFNLQFAWTSGYAVGKNLI